MYGCEDLQLLFHMIHLNSTQIVSVDVDMHMNQMSDNLLKLVRITILY